MYYNDRWNGLLRVHLFIPPTIVSSIIIERNPPHWLAIKRNVPMRQWQQTSTLLNWLRHCCSQFDCSRNNTNRQTSRQTDN